MLKAVNSACLTISSSTLLTNKHLMGSFIDIWAIFQIKKCLNLHWKSYKMGLLDETLFTRTHQSKQLL